MNVSVTCRLVLASRDFGEPNYVQCVAFDPKGEFISKLEMLV